MLLISIFNEEEGHGIEGEWEVFGRVWREKRGEISQL